MNRRGKMMAGVKGMAMAGIAMLLVFQVVFLYSCEKEISEDGAGRRVDIDFAVSNEDYTENEAVMWSSGAVEPETKVVPLGFDDLYLYATLKPDTTAALRATKAFADGQKVALAAFQTNGTQIGTTGIYTYSNALGRLVAPAVPVGVDPNNSTTYRFVAYSYFADPLNAPGTSGIDPVKDLVWGHTEKPVADNVLSRTVTILMKHKFAQVKLKVKVTGVSGARITAINNVTISGGKLASITPFSGDIGAGADVAQGLDWPTFGSYTEVTSVPRAVYPIDAPGKVTVTIGGMTIRVGSTDFPVSSFPVEFNSALAGGASYLLELSLNRMAFAGSNVYWDSGAGKMTFDVSHHGAGKYYQGVYFKFNSLVGYSPVDGTSYGSGNGDICASLASGWKVPTSAELNAIISGNTQVSGSVSTLNAAGTGLITAGRQFNTGTGTLFLPFSGGGYSTLSAAQGDAGSRARYWSSSVDVGGATYSRWCLQIKPGVQDYYASNEVNSYDSFLVVRCVRN